MVENKNTVLEPRGILVPTPCSSLSISFAFAMFHLSPLLPFKSAGNSSMWPVAGLTAALAKRGVYSGGVGERGGGVVVLCSRLELGCGCASG